MKFIPFGESVVLAGQVKMGTTSGEPGFQFRYDLGCSKKLRGFQRNRLRGRHYYLTQVEVRVSFTRRIGMVAFGGVGDVGDSKRSDFRSPKPSGGFGLRIGLPPDFVAKIRLDIGVCGDERNFYLNFNEAF